MIIDPESLKQSKPEPFICNEGTFYVSIDCKTGEVTYSSEKHRKRAEQLRPLWDAFYALLRTIPHPE